MLIVIPSSTSQSGSGTTCIYFKAEVIMENSQAEREFILTDMGVYVTGL